MTSGEPSQPLRVWPGLILAATQLGLRYGVPYFFPDQLYTAFMGSVACSLLVYVWWAFFSRATRLERFGGIALMIAAFFAARPFLDPSVATGMMHMMFPFSAIPMAALGIVAAAVIFRSLPLTPRRAAMGVVMAVAFLGWTCIRTEGMLGDAGALLHWRWTKSPEQKLLEQADGKLALPVATAAPVVIPTPAPAEPEAVSTKPVAAKPAAAPAASATPDPPAAWPGFRGPARDGVVAGVKIKTDWSTTPPVELWKRGVGPGWSSFAVRGDLLYTQEQRGDDEIVAAYNASNGHPVWAHHDAARFWESNAGAGPRGTPSVHGGRVYSLGATGILNALDARTGAVVWSRSAAKDTDTKVPGWGFSSSPLIVGDDLVVIATYGKLAAYDLATGAPRWQGPADGGGYSSPHLVKIGGVEQVLFMASDGAISVSPTDGKLLWKYAWGHNVRIVQPAVIGDGELLMDGGESSSLRRIGVTHGADGWTTQERWNSIGLKPYFNDYVFFEDHVYGFDNGILACLDARDGKRAWKGGRYGSGQLILLRDQGLLLVISEEGELALVKAAPDQFTELAKVPGIEGKTWNHPAMVGDHLWVRNGSEMAAFRLPAER